MQGILENVESGYAGGKMGLDLSAGPWRKHGECTSTLSLQRMSSWDNDYPPHLPASHCGELSLRTLPSPHFQKVPACEVWPPVDAGTLRVCTKLSL